RLRDVVQRNVKARADLRDLHDRGGIQTLEQGIIEPTARPGRAHAGHIAGIDGDAREAVTVLVEIAVDDRTNRVAECTADGQNRDGDLVRGRTVHARDRDPAEWWCRVLRTHRARPENEAGDHDGESV